MGFPIRRSSDQSSFAAPQGLSQRTTSFIASQRQGIHQMLFRHLIALMIHARRKAIREQPQTPQRTIRKTVPGSAPGTCLPNTTGHTTASKGRSWCRGQRPQPVMFPLHDVKHPQAAQRAAHESTNPSGQRPQPGQSSPKPAGGARRDRTDDLKLAKLALSQLSYGPIRARRAGPQAARRESQGDGRRRAPERHPKWWAWDDSNVRPHPYQGCALTT